MSKILNTIFACLLFAFSTMGQQAGESKTTPFPGFAAIKAKWAGKPLEETKQAALKGDVTAQHYMGRIYGDGEVVQRDYSEARKWYEMAAEKGFANSLNNLAVLYQNGNGVDVDLEQALRYFTKAAELGMPMAQLAVGDFYRSGKAGSKDPEKANQWYIKAFGSFKQFAEQGDLDSIHSLGWMYERGQGIPKDREEAVQWFRKAAEAGHRPSMYSLGFLYSEEMHVNENSSSGSFVDASDWYKKAADLGDGRAAYALGDLYKAGKLGDEKRSDQEIWYKRSAELGHLQGMAWMASRISIESVSESDLKWLKAAAAKGIPEAQFTLGAWHQAQPTADWTETIRLYKKAAIQGHAGAEFELGKLYREGKRVPRDEEKAMEWFEAAASNGNAEAQMELARILETQPASPEIDEQLVFLYMSVDRSMNWDLHTEASERLIHLWAAGRGTTVSSQFWGTDLPFAVKLEGAASDVRSPEACFEVGRLFFDGKETPQNLKSAVGWFTEAVEGGEPRACLYLGKMWSAGYNGEPDFVEAVKWLRKAALHGLGEAQVLLGQAYLEGKGVSSDKTSAFVWLTKAKQNGRPEADSILAELRKGLTQPELMAAEQRLASTKK